MVPVGGQLDDTGGRQLRHAGDVERVRIVREDRAALADVAAGLDGQVARRRDGRHVNAAARAGAADRYVAGAVVDESDVVRGDIAHGDVVAREVGEPGAGADNDGDIAAAGVDRGDRGHGDRGGAGIALAVDDAVGRGVVGDDRQVAVAGDDG